LLQSPTQYDICEQAAIALFFYQASHLDPGAKVLDNLLFVCLFMFSETENICSLTLYKPSRIFLFNEITDIDKLLPTILLFITILFLLGRGAVLGFELRVSHLLRQAFYHLSHSTSRF
jgi:hypothetical protein